MANSSTGNISAGDVDLESRLKARLEQALDDIGEGYNELEDQVHSLLKARITERLGELEEKFQTLVGSDGTKQSASTSSQSRLLNDEDRTVEKQSLKSISATVKSLQHDVDAILTSKATAVLSRLDKHQQKLDRLEKEFRRTEVVRQNQSEMSQSLQNLLVRLQKVESRNQPSVEGPAVTSFTTTALAQELLDRLAKGQVIGEAMAARLQSATANKNDPRPSDRQLHTPPTDLESSSAGTGTTRLIEEPSRNEALPHGTQSQQARSQRTGPPMDELQRQNPDLIAPQSSPAIPNSRKRPAPDSEPADEDGKAPARPAANPNRDRLHNSTNLRTPPRKRAKAAEAEPQANSGAHAEKQEEEDLQNVNSYEPRRTGRAVKPTFKLGDFKTWTEVRADRRHEREFREKHTVSRKQPGSTRRKRASI